jgi:hypothetical protein
MFEAYGSEEPVQLAEAEFHGVSEGRDDSIAGTWKPRRGPRTRRRRACVAGFILAYQTAATVQESEAATIVEACCRLNAFSVGRADTIRKWISRSNRDEVNAYRDQIISKAEKVGLLLSPKSKAPLSMKVRLAGREL